MSDVQKNATPENTNSNSDPVEVDELDEKSLESTSGGADQVGREIVSSEPNGVQCHC